MEKSNLFTILLVIITTLFFLSGVSFAEGEWATSGDNIYNTNSGNVGIGTTSPSSGKLQVDSGSDNVPAVNLTSSSAGWGSGIELVNTATGGRSYGIYVDNANPSRWHFSDATAGEDRITIDSSGNVGVGTMSPSTKLDIVGSSGITSFTGTNRLGISIRGETTAYEYSGIDFIGDATIGAYPIARIGVYRGTAGSYLQFGTTNNWVSGINNTAMTIDNNANIGIGTTTPDYKLDVQGTIRAEEVKVETGWSDFVFEEDYNLPSLETIEIFIKENKHLPDIPSAKEVQEEGLSVSEMMAKHMQKIEELTLYMIEQSKKMEEQNNQIEALKEELAELKNMN